jgi:hypothetical protein
MQMKKRELHKQLTNNSVTMIIWVIGNIVAVSATVRHFLRHMFSINNQSISNIRTIDV